MDFGPERDKRVAAEVNNDLGQGAFEGTFRRVMLTAMTSHARISSALG